MDSARNFHACILSPNLAFSTHLVSVPQADKTNFFFFFGVFCFSQKDYSLVREMSLTQGLQENL